MVDLILLLVGENLLSTQVNNFEFNNQQLLLQQLYFQNLILIRELLFATQTSTERIDNYVLVIYDWSNERFKEHFRVNKDTANVLIGKVV